MWNVTDWLLLPLIYFIPLNSKAILEEDYKYMSCWLREKRASERERVERESNKAGVLISWSFLHRNLSANQQNEIQKICKS